MRGLARPNPTVSRQGWQPLELFLRGDAWKKMGQAVANLSNDEAQLATWVVIVDNRRADLVTSVGGLGSARSKLVAQ